MPTRKQRRRRAKTFRHEYGFVMNDEEGNEVEVEGSELRARRADRGDKPRPKESRPPGRRGLRDPEPASWNRSLRRGAIWGPPIVVVAYFLLLRGVEVPVRILVSLLYALAFIPLSYWIDGVAYRRFEKRKAKASRPGASR